AAAKAAAASWLVDSRRAPSLTQVGALMGTPHYMAPELWHGEPASRSSDVYATGIVLYALLTGRTPYAGLSLTELAAAILEGKFPAIDRLVPNADPRLVSIIERCLRLNPAERYASGDELRSALEILTPVGRQQQVPTGNPYRGLRAFEAEHRSLFFGRSLEIRAVVERLRSDSFVLVAGDSGVGKSSLCRAGVIPLVQDGAIEPERSWTSVAMMPGRKPLQVLTSVLAGYLDVEEETLHALITESAVTFGWYLRKQLGAARGLIIFIDQLEELVTIADKEQAATVGAVLAQIAAGVPGVRLMASARGDFLTRVAEIPELGEEISRAIYLLRPLTHDGAREAIAGPAELQGVRFESDELVEELIDAGVEGSLPLLQFALAELWEVRDHAAAVITRANLETIGGVTGALARHGDGVLASLLPQARTEARRILVRLVTIEDTRANLSEDELTGESAEARTALEALVQGRLLVARESEDEAIYEIAHEALINGWKTLRQWLDEEREGRILLPALETAASEWERLGKPRDALWGTAALTRASLYLDETSLRPRERDFLASSRRSVARGRQLRRAAMVAIPTILGAVYGGVKVQEYQALQARVEAKLSEADEHLREAEVLREGFARLRSEAFAAIDSRRSEEGEELWAKAIVAGPLADHAFKEALQAQEGALVLDPSQADVFERLAGVLFERALLAEMRYDRPQAEELLERLRLYDTEGTFVERWSAPAHLSLTTDPPGVEVAMSRYQRGEDGVYELVDRRSLGASPLRDVELSPGSYLLEVGALRYPLMAKRGEGLELSIPLPDMDEVPEGFVYIPPGRFWAGSADDETMRKSFFLAPPLHEVATGEYMIAIYEVTFGEWLDFLDAIPREERGDLVPDVDNLRLEETAEGWRLNFDMDGEAHALGRDDVLHFPDRTMLADQHWTRWPVLGVTVGNARAYVDWLNTSGRLPGARLCTELEWERAARGADQRNYPHGDVLRPTDSNFDLTFGRSSKAHGPTEVGSFPVSVSPFGIHDMPGNAIEWVEPSFSEGDTVARGTGFAYDAVQARAYNRPVTPESMREWTTGLRLCATPRWRKSDRPASE
ncbi:MAG: SUMF1/EgtB/PvdO family nonheme iron enzyme, partial [Myxococcales bacterium]|nr:SUMF1/EgtB/PvdO family nonheme iron enzyme [Myxococcales bacterium]